MTTYRVLRTTSPRDVLQQPTRPPLHCGDTFHGHPLGPRSCWVALIEVGQRLAYVRKAAVEEVV
jgi:hypothetical protein